jgi:hypothetical protein
MEIFRPRSIRSIWSQLCYTEKELLLEMRNVMEEAKDKQEDRISVELGSDEEDREMDVINLFFSVYNVSQPNSIGNRIRLREHSSEAP